MRTWLVVRQRGARSTPRRRPRLDRTNTVRSRRHELQKVLSATLVTVARGPCAFRPARYRSTAHGARAPRSADLTWLCCGPTAQRGARSSPRCRPGLDCNNTATGRWHELRKFFFIAFEHRGARPARFLPRGVSADRPRSTRAAQCGLDVVVLWPNAGRAPPPPPHGVGRGSTAPTPRQIGDTVLERL